MKRVLLLGIVLAGLLAGTARGAGVPWHIHSQRVVPNETSTWTSNRTFSPFETLRSAVYVDGHELRSYAGCSSSEFGHGVAVVTAICEPGRSHLVVRAVSLDGEPHKVTVIYKRIGFDYY